jgi:hypothetical protein
MGTRLMAVAEEDVMSRKLELRRLYKQRTSVVRYAQDLARSGQYYDLAAILPELEPLEGFSAARARLEDRALRAQLDRLCALARDSARGALAGGGA